MISLHTPSSGQTNCTKDCSCSISGAIVDATNNEPIPYASIQIKGSTQGTLTEEDGHFILKNLCQSEFDITISHLGYKSVTHHHDIYHPELVVQLAPSNLILESIIVEGEGTTTGLSTIAEQVLTRQELELTKNESLGDALSNITGVSTLKTGQNVVKPIIHGLHSNRVLIINNGVRHESQEWGREHAPEIDPSLADNISVIKSAAAVKYGPNALGGVILIEPPKMELTSHLHGEATLRGESNGRAIDGNILLQKGYNRFAWMAQAAGRYQGDLQSANYNLTNTGARESSYALGARYHLKNTDFNVYYSHLLQQLGILRGSVVGNLEDLAQAIGSPVPQYTEDFSYDIGSPKQEVTHDLMKIKASHNFNKSQLNLQYGFQSNKRKEFDVRRGTNNERPAIDLELYTHTLDVEWLHPDFKKWEGNLGVQWLYQDNNNLPGTNTIPFIPNFNNNRLGLYIIESRPVGNTTYEIGLRYDYQFSSIRGRKTGNAVYSHDLSYQSISGIIGLKRLLGPNTSFRTNFASAWRPPNIAELYSYGKHNSTIDYGARRHSIKVDGGINMGVLDEDEKQFNSELGFKWIGHLAYSRNNHHLEVSPYINYIENYIYKRPFGITETVRGPFPFFIYEQTNALFLGVDATYFYEHSKSLESKVSATYLRARDCKNSDYFTGIPANKVSYKISLNNPGVLRNLRAGVEGSYTFKQFNAPRIIPAERFAEAKETNTLPLEQDRSIFDFLPAPEGYFLINLHADFTIGQVVTGVKINNLLNTAYRDYTNQMRYFADEQGINFALSVKIQL